MAMSSSDTVSSAIGTTAVPQPDRPVLRVRDVTLSFGGVTALIDVSFDVRGREIFALIGPNGAGKTSLLNCTSGLYHPQQGTITFVDPGGRRARANQAPAFPDRQAWRCPLLSEHRAVPTHDGAGQPDVGSPHPHEGECTDFRAILAASAERRNRPSPTGRGDHRFSRDREYPPQAGGRAGLRPAEASSSWVAPWRSNPPCCCSTSPWQA